MSFEVLFSKKATENSSGQPSYRLAQVNGIGALNLGSGSAEVSSQSARRLVCEGRQTECVKYPVKCQNERMAGGARSEPVQLWGFRCQPAGNHLPES